ncbi:RNA pyrophosphohydrolase [Phenylobacterium deserti]|uniref:RNA pyrophosphohydrolase n=1 Tax=Phenylobacterium deserti TaxID=1914756 RepID=A0A328AVT7_9CAUL|nr:RNA pyrophosphohydrolase [Phenylobacterium deserti]RAK57038.1 RNA pyrophosphohydrolase [Phenylobacterium deserti]
MSELSGYRPNVGVVLFHPDGRVWLGRRRGAPGPYNWQFPQGGIDDGEDFETAARRELTEETGAVTVSYLARTEGWITYDFPPNMGGSKAWRGFKGQKQVWFAYRFDGDDAEFDLAAHHEPEFDTWRWGWLAETPGLIVPFKRAAYEQVVTAFADLAAPWPQAGQ